MITIAPVAAAAPIVAAVAAAGIITWIFIISSGIMTT